MSATCTPSHQATRLLRKPASDLKECNTRDDDDWTGEPEAHAAPDEHLAVAQAPEGQALAICMHQSTAG